MASGFDWRTFIDQMIEVERAPQRRLRAEQSVIEERNNAYNSVETELNVLQDKVQTLLDTDLFNRRAATSSDESVATATADPSTATGTYKFTVSQLASESVLAGNTNVGSALNPTDDVSGLTLADAAFPLAVTAGNFTVNGKIIAVETTDSLQDVFDRISTATGGEVTAGYSSATDTITFSSAQPIVLGSANDSSNFLQAARLYNNGTGTVTSTSALGSLQPKRALDQANLGTSITDGGSGAGIFKINGVEIQFDSSSDSLEDVLNRINASEAGVTASYDVVQDQVKLTNKTAGDLGVSLEDVTGNFLDATGLLGGTLSRGKNLEYSLNDGGTLISQSNTITGDSSGISGLSVTATATGTTTVQVGIDSESIRTAIEDFVSAFNGVQTLIDTQTASETNADGVVTAGTLAGEREANDIASELRGLANAQVTGISGVFSLLGSIGIESNGNDNNLAVTDSAALDDAIINDLASLKALFADATNGIANRMDDYLERTIGDEGSLITKQENLTRQSSDIDQQIGDLERLIASHRESMTNQFVAMEQAQQRINQQMQFLKQRFGG